MYILHPTVICYREFLLNNILLNNFIAGICYLICYIVIVNVDKLRKSEREGFEPSVNKSLHSSSNATPSTARPSLLQ
jgi:hypothetical protein